MGNKGILILTPFFSPNIGGVESHLDDLTLALSENGYNVYVQTYSPLTMGYKINYFKKEVRNNNVFIRRYWWFGKNLFHKLEKIPLFDFFYLTPYLFIRVFIWLLFNNKKVDIIHAQGFNAAWMGVIYKNIFKKKLIVSTHAIYELDKTSKTARIIVKILNKSDKVLVLSNGSRKELISFGLSENKIDLYKHWINLDLFKFTNEQDLKNKLGVDDKFNVLFVGRLIEKKGMNVLLNIAETIPEINFLFVGNGSEEKILINAAKKYENVKFIGSINNTDLYKYYSIASLFCIPSQYEEGFGRVVMEAVACGLPVVGSNKGGIPEALDNSVSILVEPTVENIKNIIIKLYANQKLYLEMKSNCRVYAENNFSSKNLALITKYYNNIYE